MLNPLQNEERIPVMILKPDVLKIILDNKVIEIEYVNESVHEYKRQGA